MKIKIYTNSRGSGDYIIVEQENGNRLFEGHSINSFDLMDILSQVGNTVEIMELNDEQMEVL